MNLYSISVNFCNASQFSWGVTQYLKNRTIIPKKHICIESYYPINASKNSRDMRMLCEALDIEYWDPGKDLGSCQSQNWALNKLEDCDAFWNIDPDSNCPQKGWDVAQKIVLENDTDCAAISCMSPMVKTFIEQRDIKLEQKEINGIKYGIARQPVPFNLSLFNVHFIKQIGGLKQLGERWGELEACFFHSCRQNNKYHAYLLDYTEDESGKFLQDRQLLEYKDRYMRTSGPEQFIGSYEEFLKLYYPELLKIDTYISEGTVFK